jgi:hypothetical protein
MPASDPPTSERFSELFWAHTHDRLARQFPFAGIVRIR